jgi:hypothetical protein
MSTDDLIAEERRRYNSSGRTGEDWFRYITAVERLRRRSKNEIVSNA